MQSALDTFRAQREAADQVHTRLTEVAQLLERLTREVDAVAGNADLRAVLRETTGNQVRAAQILGINRNTLRKKLTEHDIDPDHLGP